MGIFKLLGAVCFLALFLNQVSIANQDVWLVPHNAARHEVGVPPLCWNASLEEYAVRYAHARYHDCMLEHSDYSAHRVGENLAHCTGDMTPEQAIKSWVDEKPFYDFQSNTCNGGECGHYTQVVWRETQSLGCAIIKCATGGVLATCNYWPCGNVVGHRPY